MPSFNPNLPLEGTPLDAAEVRGNFVALKTLIDALPAGPQGPPGPAGSAGPPGVGCLPRGDWDHDTTYGPGDVVIYNGQVWLCLDVVTGGQPDTSNWWRQLSIVGPAGNDGQPGSNGAAGRGIVNVRDNGDGRAIITMSDGTEYGPFTIANGPAGPPGERGSDGSQGPVGNDGRGIAEVYDSGDGRAMIRMTDGQIYGPFTVATGPQGAQGPPGADSTVPGPQGETGPAGADGRGIANVRDSGDGTGRCFIDMTDGQTYGPFTIANGPAGMNGNDGRGISAIRDNGDGTLTVFYTDGTTAGPFAMPSGPQGPAGNDGAPGEVTTQQMNDAIGSALAGSSNNTNTVATLDENADPATIIAKLNELIGALRR